MRAAWGQNGGMSFIEAVMQQGGTTDAAGGHACFMLLLQKSSGKQNTALSIYEFQAGSVRQMLRMTLLRKAAKRQDTRTGRQCQRNLVDFKPELTPGHTHIASVQKNRERKRHTQKTTDILEAYYVQRSHMHYCCCRPAVFRRLGLVAASTAVSGRRFKVPG